MRGEDIQKRIIEYLEAQEWPSTTGDVARGVNISWNTAELHLTKLQMQGKVKFRKVVKRLLSELFIGINLSC